MSPPPSIAEEVALASFLRSSAGRALLEARRIGGLWSSSAAFVAAALAAAGRGPALVVTADPESARAFLGDLRLFLDDPDAAWPFPAYASARLLPDRVDDATLAARLRALERIPGAAAKRPILVGPLTAVLQPVPEPRALRGHAFEVGVGRTIPLERIAERLDTAGFTRTRMVERPGDWSLRGGILDVFPLTNEPPWRIELFGDEIESIRRFEPATQRSIDSVREARLNLLPRGEMVRPSPEASIVEHLPRDARVAFHEPDRIRVWIERLADRDDAGGVPVGRRLEPFERLARDGRRLDLTSAPVEDDDEGANLAVRSVSGVSREIETLRSLVETRLGDARRVLFFCNNRAEAHRVSALAGVGEDDPRVRVLVGRLQGSFHLVESRTAILSHDDVVGRTVRRDAADAPPSQPLLDLGELKPGDYVVHLTHGIGRYCGLERIVKRGEVGEFLKLEFRDRVELFVPAAKANLVQRYVGAKELKPRLSRLGAADWAKRTARVARAVESVAADLLEIQAHREQQRGIAFPPDDADQIEFEAAFVYEDTPDQESATREIKDDMTARRPMDRLVCGDVGYGKTEVAMRAAFKAVGAGRQVAVLVPTTVLAQQHYQTFTERMADYPINIGVLSRFQTKAQQRRMVERAAVGGVDILIGTHRLLSKDVAFADLGLVVIDEEQRFGVDAKTRLKRLRRTVDVLTLTATPIPRTLHMALVGMRDISSLTTPPTGRRAVRTEVRRFEEDLVRRAILREIDRGGQVYFVHNRVRSIQRVADELMRIVPEARYAVVHGQMAEKTLEARMVEFLDGRVDVLVTTTIIESGLDIPRANTMFIDRAEMFGLADLHQLRGRVGRYHDQAWCYLLLRPDRVVPADGERRLRAIEELTELGAGFQISMRDLELRGAGNILGTEQSGHIAAVGYELYCDLLDQAVRRIQGLEPEGRTETFVELPLEAHLPPDYVPDEALRIDLYRRIGRARDEAAILDVAGELVDRFGAPPEPVRTLLRLAAIRTAASRAGIRSVTGAERRAILRVERPNDARAALEGVWKYVREVEPGIVHLVPPSEEDLLRFLERAFGIREVPARLGDGPAPHPRLDEPSVPHPHPRGSSS